MYEFSVAEILRRRSTFWALYGVGTALFVISLALWWAKVSVQPQRVFWGMINNSLATTGVTLQVSEGSGSNVVSQSIQYSLGATQRAHGFTTLKQGQQSASITELVGDAKHTYSRYVSIKSPGVTNAKLKNVLNVWAKADIQNTSTKTTTQLLSQAALGIGMPVGAIPIPIADLSAAQRAALVQSMQTQQVYQTGFSNVKRQTVNGRLQYVYTVTMQPILYMDIMKQFATDVGLHDLDSVDVNSYSGSAAISVVMTVDAHAQQLVSIDAGQDVKETYSGYGIATQTSLPTHAISAADLQARLAKVK